MDPRRFGPQRLRVYALALTLADQVLMLGRSRRCTPSVRTQLQRCTESIVLNIAEGAGHNAPRQKAHFYRVARGSAAECMGGLDLLSRQDRHLDIRSARTNAAMIALMLQRLIDRLESHA
jgi:four helix bundle protein